MPDRKLLFPARMGKEWLSVGHGKSMEVKTLKKYEAVFILDIRKVDDEGNSFSEQFSKLIESWGGKMEETILMGRKQFARMINKKKAGIYWNYVFSLAADKVENIQKQYMLDNKVLRLMVTNYEKPDK